MYRQIYVNCKNCGRISQDKDTEFVDIEEDFQGRDILTFICKKCGKQQKSLRFS